MHRRQRELLRNSLVALAAGLAEVGVVDRGMRIARGQNIVYAMATGAVGRDHRAAFCRKPVIAVHVTGYAVARYAKLL